MTTDEIKKMITDTLQGQGNQVDLGGGIPKILNGLLSFIETQQEAISKMVLDLTALDWQGVYVKVSAEKEASIMFADHLLIRNTGDSNARMDGLLSFGLNNQDQDTLGDFILKVAPQLRLETIWGVWGNYAFYPDGPSLNYAEGYALVHDGNDVPYLVYFLYKA